MSKVYIVYKGDNTCSMYHDGYEVDEVMVKIFDCESKAVDYMCSRSQELIAEDIHGDMFTRPITACRVRENIEVFYALWGMETEPFRFRLKYICFNGGGYNEN